MEVASPARLYAGVLGAALLVLGILGFFYSASFGELDHYEEALGGLQVNGWTNLFYLAVGALGLLLAGVASRPFALGIGLLFTALGILGWGSGGLQLAIGLLGLAAAAGTPRSLRSASRGSKVGQGTTREPRRSKPRAKPARQRS
jgi:hypothetical protein